MGLKNLMYSRNNECNGIKDILIRLDRRKTSIVRHPFVSNTDCTCNYTEYYFPSPDQYTIYSFYLQNNIFRYGIISNIDTENPEIALYQVRFKHLLLCSDGAVQWTLAEELHSIYTKIYTFLSEKQKQFNQDLKKQK